MNVKNLMTIVTKNQFRKETRNLLSLRTLVSEKKVTLIVILDAGGAPENTNPNLAKTLYSQIFLIFN